MVGTSGRLQIGSLDREATDDLEKIGGNISRAKVINRKLRAFGIKVVRFWEHDVKECKTLEQLEATVRRRVG